MNTILKFADWPEDGVIRFLDDESPYDYFSPSNHHEELDAILGTCPWCDRDAINALDDTK